MTNKIIIIGGGAAGFFGAIACAEADPLAQVTILEKTRQLLTKVRISGGGRCNVTHSCFQPAVLAKHYPRGSKALQGPFTRFQPTDTIQWFADRGVELHTEADGRMFPTTDQSETIIACLMKHATQAGVKIRLQAEVAQIKKDGEEFVLTLQTGEEIVADKVLMASGSNPKAQLLIESLGHKVVPAVPSLFTFNITDPRLEGIAGISVPMADLRIIDTPLEQSGPLLITHWGLSGPAVLKLSAWGARILNGMNYEAELVINWAPEISLNEAEKILGDKKAFHPQRMVALENCLGLPKNLWKKLVQAAGIEEQRLFAHLSKKEIQALLGQVFQGHYPIRGKSTYKEEFVTAGGVDLNEVNFQRMESRVCPGLFFAGEVLDIDGITGGFNFQNAWTTSWLAAQAISG